MLKNYARALVISSLLLAGCTFLPNTPMERRHAVDLLYDSTLTTALNYIKECKKTPPESACYSHIPVIKEHVAKADFAHEQMKTILNDGSQREYIDLAIAGAEAAIANLDASITGAPHGR